MNKPEYKEELWQIPMFCQVPKCTNIVSFVVDGVGSTSSLQMGVRFAVCRGCKDWAGKVVSEAFGVCVVRSLVEETQ
jgi:hypothetical protein